MRSVDDDTGVPGHLNPKCESVRGSAVFWIVSVVAVASIPIIELMLPRVSPKRFWHEDVYKSVYFLPIAICWWVSIWTGGSISIRQRIWSGLIQAAALVFLTYREYEVDSMRTVLGVSSQSSVGLIAFWALLILAYTVAFGVITHRFR